MRRRTGNGWIPWVPGWVLAVTLCGCGASFDYSSGSASRALTEDRRRSVGLAVTEIMDGRLLGKPSALPLATRHRRTEDFAQLRGAFRSHAENAGLAPEGARLLRAPRTPAEARRLLQAARQRGAKLVLFVRLENLYARGYQNPVTLIMTLLGVVPGLICMVLPINSEYAAARVRAFLVDPATDRVLFSAVGNAVLNADRVTAWGYGPMREMKGVLYQAVDRAFRRVGRALKSGRLQGGGQASTMIFAPAVGGGR